MKNSITLVFLIALLCVQCEWYKNLPTADSGSYYPSVNDDIDYSNDDTNYYPTKAKPGYCYAKSMIPDKYDVEEIELAIYAGNEDEEDIELEIL